jgi:RNA polymerase sigma-70 factor, ECF subfamily
MMLKGSLPDQTLAARAIEGDADAFGVLYERYQAQIHRYIFYHVADRQEAEDLTITAFIKAWEALPGLQSFRVSFRAWLFRIAHNTVIDFYRTRKQVSEITDDFNSGKQDNPEAEFEKANEHRRLIEAVQALRETFRQVIICRFVCNFSHAETGQIMGLREQHVRVLQYRALKELRKRLEQVS